MAVAVIPVTDGWEVRYRNGPVPGQTYDTLRQAANVGANLAKGIGTELVVYDSNGRIQYLYDLTNPATADKLLPKEENMTHEDPDELHLRRAERIRVYEAMQKYGGGFARALAEAFIRADDENERKLRAAFHDLFEHYREMARISESENERPDF